MSQGQMMLHCLQDQSLWNLCSTRDIFNKPPAVRGCEVTLTASSCCSGQLRKKCPHFLFFFFSKTLRTGEEEQRTMLWVLSPQAEEIFLKVYGTVRMCSVEKCRSIKTFFYVSMQQPWPGGHYVSGLSVRPSVYRSVSPILVNTKSEERFERIWVNRLDFYEQRSNVNLT